MSEEEKVVRVIPFSGKKSDWPVWSGKFMSNARVKGFLKILTGEETPPRDDAVLDPSKDSDKEPLRKRKANSVAYNALVQSMVTATLFQKVANAVTDDNPEGDAGKAWTSLRNKYEPNSMSVAANYEKEFMELELTLLDTEPEEYIDALEAKRMVIKRISEKKIIIDDKKFMRHVLSSLPMEYDESVKDLMKSYEEDKLDIEDMTRELTVRYSLLKRRKKQRTDETEGDVEGEERDLALVLPPPTSRGQYVNNMFQQRGYRQGPRQFKGMCMRCGEIGH